MKINRDNYEEYFLLYTDHELSADLRKEVERFVQQNPDLKEELEVLQSLKMQPEMHIGLGNKEFLLKEITSENAEMEEFMLLHLDNELDAKKAENLEAAIASNEILRKDWELLVKTRLQPEAVVFERKEVLYRKETGIIPMFTMRWTRYAAAAALILVLGLLWLNRGDQDPAIPGAEIAQQLDQPEKAPASGQLPALPSLHDGSEEMVSAAESGKLSGSLAAQDRKAGNEDISAVTEAQRAKLVRAQDRSSEKKVVLEEPGKNESVRFAQEPLVAKTLEKTPAKPLASEITDQAVGSPEPEIRADYATRALMDQTEGESIQYESAQSNRKGPLRGIVRKANRIFHKVTNPDMDKPLVKVASFEIALAN